METLDDASLKRIPDCDTKEVKTILKRVWYSLFFENRFFSSPYLHHEWYLVSLIVLYLHRFELKGHFYAYKNDKVLLF